MTQRRALWLLIAVSSACRLLFACCVGAGNDEAYGALWALHLDWSFFDHPPMMAVVARLGMLLAGDKLSLLAMRSGFIVLAAGSTWLMARLTTRFFGERAGLIAAFLLNVTPYYGVAAGIFILPDGPLLFFWLLTLDRLAAALETPERIGPWIGMGVAWGCALLSKYHAVFLPMGATLYMVIEPTARRQFRRFGPYLAFAIGLVIFSPVIYWNRNHHWASFAFQGGRAQPGGGFRPDALAWAIVGPSLYLFPWIWLALWLSLIRASRRVWTGKDGSPPDKFFLAQAVVPLTVFLAISSRKMTLPHWSLIGLIPAFPLLARDLLNLPRITLRRRAFISAAIPILGMILFATQAQWGLIQKGGVHRLGLLDPIKDPTVDMFGWDQVAIELNRRGILDLPGDFLFTSKWYHSGHLAFAIRGRMPVLCYSEKSAHNFEYWEDSSAWTGHDGILVVVNETSTEPAMYEPWFERIELLTEFPITRAGGIIRRVRVYRCVNQLRKFPEKIQAQASIRHVGTNLPPGWPSSLEWGRRIDPCRETPWSSWNESEPRGKCRRSWGSIRSSCAGPSNIFSPKRRLIRSATAASSRSSHRRGTRTIRSGPTPTA